MANGRPGVGALAGRFDGSPGDGQAGAVRPADDPRNAARPTRRVAILACMDARIEPAGLLGFHPGEAHVVRNAGGLATDDAIRSLVVSQRALGTEEVVVLHHTGCGMADLDGEEILAAMREETGERPPFELRGVGDAATSVRMTAGALRASPFLRIARIRGFVYDHEDERLDPVTLP